jgi:hypothetical protein
MAQAYIIICMIIGLIWGITEMIYENRHPTITPKEPHDPNQTGNSRTRRGMFDIFNPK